MKRAYLLVAFLLVAGCAPIRDFPKYDQVLVYDKAFDYTFLRTLEAVNMIPGWTIQETDKEKGLIVLRNVQYGSLFDKDKNVARLQVRRLDRKKTSVSLDPSSQRLQQAGELLRRVDDVMTLSAMMKGEQRAQLIQ